MNKVKTYLVRLVAFITRHFHPKGTERLLRLIYNPDRTGKDFRLDPEVVPYYDKKILADPSSLLEWHIYFKGSYSADTVDFIRERVKPDWVSIDVGANIGTHVLAEADGKTVYAIEPEPGAVEDLRENLRVSGTTNVEVLNFALSDREGSMTLYSPKEGDSNQANASLYHDKTQSGRKPVTVDVKTLDDAFQDLDRLDFLKIDVIGYDLRVIRGGLKTIEKFHPLIMFRYNEHHWNDTGSTLEEAVTILESMGYKISQLEDGELSDKLTAFSCKMVAFPPS